MIIIDLWGLSIAILMTLGVLGISWWIAGPVKDLSVSIARMVIQLIAIGYVLTYIFSHKDDWLIILILGIMLSVASWISLRPIVDYRKKMWISVMGALAIGALIPLFILIFFILKLHPWYQPKYVIPIAGMVISNGMNAVSLALDRFIHEMERHQDFCKARTIAFRTSMIPNINMLMAVGLVSLPGMMTGQILAGASPLVAVRYQIVIMCMVLVSAAVSSILSIQCFKVSMDHHGSNG